MRKVDSCARDGLGKVPPRPSRTEERLAQALLVALSPRLPSAAPPPMPASFRPFQDFTVDRRDEPGRLAATWYPSQAESARGAVLMVHPWHSRGRSFFHRHRRVPILRRAGYHVMTFDLGGAGESGPRPSRFPDRDVLDALHALERRTVEQEGRRLPLHLWGVCHGGYWAHLALARSVGVGIGAPGPGNPEGVAIGGAFFEDVPFHLLHWSKRQAPWGLPFYLFFEHALRRSHPYLDLRRQAAALEVASVAYISGALDTTVRPEETRELAAAGGWPHRIIEDADHLQCVRRRPTEVTDLALRTFAAAEETVRDVAAA